VRRGLEHSSDTTRPNDLHDAISNVPVVADLSCSGANAELIVLWAREGVDDASGVAPKVIALW
jgi:hypothetical protein